MICLQVFDLLGEFVCHFFGSLHRFVQSSRGEFFTDQFCKFVKIERVALGNPQALWTVDYGMIICRPICFRLGEYVRSAVCRFEFPETVREFFSEIDLSVEVVSVG